MSEQLRYPIGRFERPGVFDPSQLRQFINEIEKFPGRLVAQVGPMTPTQQNQTYRPEGWTARQVVHHCADSHLNAFTRFKLALTEDMPTIKPYMEALWAEQTDYNVPVVHSIKIIEGLHYRWTALLKNMSASDFEKKYFHPEMEKEWNLYEVVALYAWHCNHHLGHVRIVAERRD